MELNQHKEDLPDSRGVETLHWGCRGAQGPPGECPEVQASCLQPTDPCPHYQLDGPGATGNGTVGRLQAMGDLRQLCIQLELQSDLWQIHSSTEFNKKKKKPSRTVHCIIYNPTTRFPTTLPETISSHPPFLIPHQPWHWISPIYKNLYFLKLSIAGSQLTREIIPRAMNLWDSKFQWEWIHDNRKWK